MPAVYAMVCYVVGSYQTIAPRPSGAHFIKKRAGFQSELAFSFTTVCIKLPGFQKASSLFLAFHKATRLLWHRKYVRYAVIGQIIFDKS